MKSKLVISVSLLLLMLVSLLPGFTACSSGSSGGGGGGGAEFEAIRQAADEWVNNGKPLNMTAKQLYDLVMSNIGLSDYQMIWYDPTTYTRAPIIIDVRSWSGEMNDAYPSGHIPGSISIPWREITQWKNLNKLTKERPLVVYSDTGETGAAAAAVLNVLGYPVTNLMWGMTAWTADTTAAPGRYDKARDTVWDWGGSYRAICPISEPTDLYDLPVVNNTSSSDKTEIIRAAADKFLMTWKQDELSSPALYNMLYFEQKPQSEREEFMTNPVNPGDNPYVVPYLLDIRDDETYLNGHLCGTQHILFQDLFKDENLKKLPTDRQILVYDTTGMQSAAASALLNMLGYDSINLRWGMTSWSLSLPGKDVAPDRFDPIKDVMNYPFLTGFQSFQKCPG